MLEQQLLFSNNQECEVAEARADRCLATRVCTPGLSTNTDTHLCKTSGLLAYLLAGGNMLACRIEKSNLCAGACVVLM
jgi:hypothetical protein